MKSETTWYLVTKCKVLAGFTLSWFAGMLTHSFMTHHTPILTLISITLGVAGILILEWAAGL